MFLVASSSVVFKYIWCSGMGVNLLDSSIGLKGASWHEIPQTSPDLRKVPAQLAGAGCEHLT